MIQVSEAAKNQIKSILQAEQRGEDAFLRIQVRQGGCSGLSYKLEFQNEQNENDKVFEQEGFKISIDPKSYLYIIGMTLDYSGGLNGTGFSFTNPNAKKTCGCGSSFAV
ncbi:MAG: iron-sulfur cluster assembly accessory protein [Bdellovibrionota bacterium]|nr:iron-sulfur cluster assembly accessory protein [Bdellovibrionota bacterium]